MKRGRDLSLGHIIIASDLEVLFSVVVLNNNSTSLLRILHIMLQSDGARDAGTLVNRQSMPEAPHLPS
jgi:hypothetical protein